MRTKNILPPEEIDFLRVMHENLYFEGLEKRKVFLKNGVHQGSPVSPALFNIYIEDMIAHVSRELGDQIWYKLYADYLVLITKHRHIYKLIKFLRTSSTEYSLKINEKKSGIFLNHKRVSQIEATIDGFPVIHSYPYLGVTLDNKGNLMPQLKAIEKRAKYLISAMKYFAKDLTFENQFLIWSAYIRPYFLYICTPVMRYAAQNDTSALPLTLEKHSEEVPGSSLVDSKCHIQQNIDGHDVAEH